jgi:mannose-6-phosphate isomerase-like protein (cupin superfamily)
MINLKEHFAKFSDHWNPRVIDKVNECAVKIVKLKGEFVWYRHRNEVELFLVVRRLLRMQFREHESIIHEGKFIIVPRGAEHQPVADEEVHVLLIEPQFTQ